MEDSGIDSDQKSSAAKKHDQGDTAAERNEGFFDDETEFRPARKSSSDLQKKIERHREANRRVNSALEPSSKIKGLLTRNRLSVPSKKEMRDCVDAQPLVMIDSESEDEFAVPRLTRQAQREITQQLIRDGYNLDLAPDDEDLDLIPPRPIHERCICCNTQINCSIQ